MPGSGIDKKMIDEKIKIPKTPKNPKNMALPKGVKSPVDYTKLFMSNQMDGDIISEKAVSKKQQQFFGIVRAIQKGEQAPTTPETAKAAADMKKSDVKKFASTKHKKLPDKIEEKLDNDDKPFVKKLVKNLRKGSNTHAKQADKLEKAMNEDITDEALTIQDWNVDEIKFTEIETVDIIKPKPIKESMSNWREELDEDWQSVNRKDKTDGMSKKAVKAYRRENPGSKLKTAVTKDPKKLKKGSKSAKRRLSFCRRMKGMKKRLTSAKTARDPDSRINKALRRWNC
jgi:hypothetical protein